MLASRHSEGSSSVTNSARSNSMNYCDNISPTCLNREECTVSGLGALSDFITQLICSGIGATGETSHVGGGMISGILACVVGQLFL